MQKLSPGYILTKLILFSVFTAVGACFSFMLLKIAEKSDLTPALARTVAGALGLIVWCILTFRTVMTAKLNKISKNDYILGEGIAATLFLTIAAVCATAFGEAALYEGLKNIVFLPMMAPCYLADNLYVGLGIQLVFCTLFVFICYEIKRKKDPTLLGRTKGSEQK